MITHEYELFCKYCPCTNCNGNKENNKKTTGYSFIPDPDFCKQMFKDNDTEISYNTFLRSVFELHGSTVNKDWTRWLNKE